jgi:alpha-glucosidase
MGFIDFSNPHFGSVLFWGARDAKTNQLSLSLSGSFFSGEDGLALTTVLTSFTGRMKRLPIWVGEGAILGIEGGSAIVQDGYRNMTSWGVPLVGVWMQDWAGSKNYTEGTRCLWNWQLNYDQYPDWHKMTDEWKKDGVRPFVYLNPYFGNYTELGLRSDYFKFLDENKYFIKNSENETYQIPSGSINFAMVDLTNPKAYDWVVDLIQKNIVEEAGAAGWMHDFGEYTPLDAHVWDRSDQVAYHNKYSEDWARSAYDATKTRKDLIWFMRAGSGNSPKYTRLQWMGDQNHNLDRYDGLHSALIGLLNSGITGWGMGHSDIGGYTTVN